MTQSNKFSNNLVIDSKQIFNKIESDIIRLAQVLQVEYRCTTDESIEYIRKFLLKKHKEVMNPELITLVNDINTDIQLRIKSRKMNDSDSKILKLFRELNI